LLVAFFSIFQCGKISRWNLIFSVSIAAAVVVAAGNGGAIMQWIGMDRMYQYYYCPAPCCVPAK